MRGEGGGEGKCVDILGCVPCDLLKYVERKREEKYPKPPIAPTKPRKVVSNAY